MVEISQFVTERQIGRPHKQYTNIDCSQHCGVITVTLSTRTDGTKNNAKCMFTGRNATMSKKIAFMAGLTHNMASVEEDTDVLLDNVVTNVGEAYDRLTGRFTAPVDGVYEFAVNIAAQGKSKAAVKLMSGSNMIFTVWSESLPLWGTASNTAILALRKGDKVWLQTIPRFSFLHGFMYSTFSGHLLFEND